MRLLTSTTVENLVYPFFFRLSFKLLKQNRVLIFFDVLSSNHYCRLQKLYAGRVCTHFLQHFAKIGKTKILLDEKRRSQYFWSRNILHCFGLYLNLFPFNMWKQSWCWIMYDSAPDFPQQIHNTAVEIHSALSQKIYY